MDKKNTLNFVISHNTYTCLNRYAKTVGISVRTAINYLLYEQICLYVNSNSAFNEKYRKDTYHSIKLKADDDADELSYKKYSLPVTEFIHRNVMEIKKLNIKEENNKQNKSPYQTPNSKMTIVVNKLIHMGLAEKLERFDLENAPEFKELEIYKERYSISLSNDFWNKLIDYSDESGVEINKLISLIIGDYMINDYIKNGLCAFDEKEW